MFSVLYMLVVALFIWFVYDNKRYSSYPPGPVRIPLLGCLLSIARLSSYPHIALQKLSEVFGDIVYVRMGFTNAVAFNSYETVRDILNHEHAANRSQTMLPLLLERLCYKNIGIVFGNGKEWRTIRGFSIRTLRDLGFGKEASMDVMINEELEKFIEHLKELSPQNPGGIQRADRLYALTITNLLWRLITGCKCQLDDANMLRLLRLNHEIFQTTNLGMDLTIAFPQLYHVFPKWMGKTTQLTILNKLKDFVRETIDHHRKLGDYKISPNCYIDEFLHKIEENKNNPTTEYTEDQLLVCLLDLFQTGADTTNNTLSFSILYMILHPEIQEKVQAEIDANVPKNEGIMLQTKKGLPYTSATLLECMRYSTVVPLTPPREASEDFYFKGHFIKKGMILLGNIHAVHFSSDIWKDPHNFRPERFLDTDGKLNAKVSSHLLPFGNGSRKCPAVSFAEASLFIYFATILRNFKVLKTGGSDGYSVEPNLGVTLSPKPYKALFVQR